MRLFTILPAAAMACALSAAGAASATTVDFTDRAVWTGPASTTSVFGATVTIASTNGVIGFGENFNGPAGSAFCQTGGGPLACQSDGLGVNDDEISRGARVESVTVTFSAPVRVTGLHFLDLFRSRHNDANFESARVFFDGVGPNVFDATQPNGGGRPGYRFVGVPGVLISSLVFEPGFGNDDEGLPDFALAGIDVAPVPLPASALLLFGGFAGFAALRRRRPA